MKHQLRLLGRVALLLVVAACGGGVTPPPPPPPPAPVVASITITPDAPSLLVGTTIQLTATVRDAGNNILLGQTITWASDNSAVATVSGMGLVSSAGFGRATASATVGGKSASVQISVYYPAQDSVRAGADGSGVVHIGSGSAVTFPAGSLPPGAVVVAKESPVSIPVKGTAIGPTFSITVHSASSVMGSAVIQNGLNLIPLTATLVTPSTLSPSEAQDRLFAFAQGLPGTLSTQSSPVLPSGVTATPGFSGSLSTSIQLWTTAGSTPSTLLIQLTDLPRECTKAELSDAERLQLLRSATVTQPGVDPVVLVLVHGWQVTGVTCSDVQAFDYSGESTWAGFISTFFPVGGGVEPRLRQLEVWKFRYMSRGKIAQVGADLADLINRRFAGRRVLILAHSKGGIIAAAAMLASGSSPVRGLITAGTPWNGTRAGELQNRLGMGCALFTSILPVECTRAQLAVIGAVDLTPAPSGDIAQLITPRLGMLLGRVSVIGSAITLTNHFPGPDPLWREFYDGLQFIVPGGPNDGLVPLSSSVPGSTFSPAFTFSGFNHSSYFSVTPSGVSSTPQAAIKNELIRWLDAIDPPLGPASMIVAASATNQSAPVNSSVTIAAKVTEASDRAIPGYVVTFSVTAGGGSFQPSGQTQVQVATGLDGTASTTWKLGPGSGTNNNTATASASGLVGSPVTFLASGSVGLISWDQVSGGGQHTCALTALGRGYCWGTSNNDVLGIDPSSTNWRIPNPILLTEPLSSILAGNEHTCALTVTGRAYCWGFNINGNVGDGTASPRSIPTLVVGQLVFAQIAVGQTHTCARTASGEIYCWGDNSSGQLGDGTLQTRYQPVLARGGAKFAQVVASGRKTCGRTSVGNVQCWGNVYVGMDNVVGYGFVDITAGYTHICGLTAAGRAYCWGEGGRGQLGGGTATFSQDPTPVQGGYTFLELLAGGWHTCGRTSASVLCWGYDFYGELGNNRSIFDFQDVKPTPFLVVGGLNFARIGAGDYHTCGRTVSGRLYCWGYNVLGQLGDNTFTDRPAPTLVLEP